MALYFSSSSIHESNIQREAMINTRVSKLVSKPHIHIPVCPSRLHQIFPRDGGEASHQDNSHLNYAQILRSASSVQVFLGFHLLESGSALPQLASCQDKIKQTSEVANFQNAQWKVKLTNQPLSSYRPKTEHQYVLTIWKSKPTPTSSRTKLASRVHEPMPTSKLCPNPLDQHLLCGK